MPFTSTTRQALVVVAALYTGMEQKYPVTLQRLAQSWRPSSMRTAKMKWSLQETQLNP